MWCTFSVQGLSDKLRLHLPCHAAWLRHLCIQSTCSKYSRFTGLSSGSTALSSGSNCPTIACLLAATDQPFAVPPQHSQSVDQHIASLRPVVHLMNLLLQDALAETIIWGTDAAAYYHGHAKGQQDSAVQQLAAWDKQLDQWPAASPEVLSLSDVEHIAARAVHCCNGFEAKLTPQLCSKSQ